MRNYLTFKEIFKKYLMWMLFSYILVWIIYYSFVFTKQKEKIIKLKQEKELTEFNYLKIKVSPNLIKNMEEIIQEGENKINNFEWLINSTDPGFTLFNYLYPICRQNNINLREIENLENYRAKLKDKYFFWKVKLSGSFLNLLRTIDKIENGEKYLKIEEIKIETERGNNTEVVYTLILSGIKKNE